MKNSFSSFQTKKKHFKGKRNKMISAYTSEICEQKLRLEIEWKEQKKITIIRSKTERFSFFLKYMLEMKYTDLYKVFFITEINIKKYIYTKFCETIP